MANYSDWKKRDPFTQDQMNAFQQDFINRQQALNPYATGEVLGTSITPSTPFIANGIEVTEDQYNTLKMIDSLARSGYLSPSNANSMIAETFMTKPQPSIYDILGSYLGTGGGVDTNPYSLSDLNNLEINVPDNEVNNLGIGNKISSSSGFSLSNPNPTIAGKIASYFSNLG